MKFTTVQAAFNHYVNKTVGEMETRAAQIKQLVDTDVNADIATLNIELDGIKQAKDNVEQRSQQSQSFNPITGTSFKKDEKKFDETVFETPEYRTAFFKKLLNQPMNEVETRAYNAANDIVHAEKRLDAFNTVTNSAAVVPTQTLNEVVRKARTKGGLLSVSRAFNLPANISVPVGTPGSKALWHVEGAAVETEKADTVAVKFAGNELIKIFSISALSKTMTVPAFEAYLIEELSNCVMETVEDSLVNGTGEAQGTGIDTITWTVGTNAVAYTKDATPKYIDFVNTMAKLKRGYAAGATWAMNNATLYTHVYGVVDLNERPIFIADPKGESIGKILGHEVVIDDNIADGEIFLGNFNYLGYNMPGGIVVEVSRESSFKSGLVDYRALAIADTKPIVTEAFVKLQEAIA